MNNNFKKQYISCLDLLRENKELCIVGGTAIFAAGCVAMKQAFPFEADMAIMGGLAGAYFTAMAVGKSNYSSNIKNALICFGMAIGTIVGVVDSHGWKDVKLPTISMLNKNQPD